ncbi:MAG TPA: DnaJ C-terminal domain-containing protein, partial [Ramlibacter sp.]|nr:DnaJ C-terminal domain-containing protein [Ramlibacter sp.]
CAGEGSIRPPLWFGWLAASHPCGSCGGRGRTAVTCPGCRGQASARCRYHGRVRIPAGVRDGQELRAWVQVEGHGRQALALRVALQPHPLFGLDDDGTVQVEVPVDGFDWIGERWIEVPTLQGVKEMRLQRGAQTYRIREAGFPGGVGGTPADCVVRVVPLFPSAWTRQQEALLDQLVATNTGDAKTEPGARTAAWKRRAGVGR